MIYELESGNFSKVTPLFREHKQYIPVFAIIDGNFPGRIFVDNKDSPGTALVWAITRWAYIEGDPQNSSFNDPLAKLIRDIIIPDSLKMKMSWLEIYAPHSSKWTKMMETYLYEFKPEKHYEMVYTFDEQKYRTLRKPSSLPTGYLIEKIEFPIIPDSALNSSLIKEDFKTKTSFGFRLKKDHQVISICRSFGFISGNEFMIDIETFEEKERCKGYATAVGKALIDYCLEKGYIPLWETTMDNIPSQKVAEKLGFVENESYPVYAIEFKHL
jgi:RimJ/RimL family protein N-acetyltransferase